MNTAILIHHYKEFLGNTKSHSQYEVSQNDSIIAQCSSTIRLDPWLIFKVRTNKDYLCDLVPITCVSNPPPILSMDFFTYVLCLRFRQEMRVSTKEMD